MKRSITLTTALIALVTVSLRAQPVANDYIVGSLGSAGRIYALRQDGANVRTIASFAPGTTTQAVAMSQFNTGLFALNDTSTLDAFSYVTPGGTTSTIATMPQARVSAALAIDQDGTFAVARFDTIYKVDPVGKTVKTLRGGLPFVVNALTIDNDTGDYIVGTTKGQLLRVDRVNLSVKTFATGLGSITGLDHDPRTGNFAVVKIGVLMIVSRSGNVVDSVATIAGQSVKIDDGFGRFHVAGGSNIQVFDRKLNLTKTLNLPTTQATSIEIYGSRKVAGFGSTQKGASYTLRLNFQESGGRNYGCAINLAGLRPGIPIAGRVINMFPDALFFLSASDGLDGFFTNNFLGTLGSTGRATAFFVLPQYLPAGTSIYAAANAVNPSKPGGLDLGHTICVTPR